MSIRAVMGVGPRTGTSFVMLKLKEAGVPIYWDDMDLPLEGNPDGYFDCEYESVNKQHNVVMKIWPRVAFFAEPEIERMVVLRRDRGAQLKSVRLQLERETDLLEDVNWTAEEHIDYAAEALEYIDAPRLEVNTHDIDERLDEIIDYMRYQ